MTRMHFRSCDYCPVFFNDRINFLEIMPSVKNEDLTPTAYKFPSTRIRLAAHFTRRGKDGHTQIMVEACWFLLIIAMKMAIM